MVWDVAMSGGTACSLNLVGRIYISGSLEWCPGARWSK